MLTGKSVVRVITAILCMAGVLVGATGSAASAAGGKAPIVIGFITDGTGSAASSYIDSVDGAEARFDAVNAAGGVDGHKIELVTEDDQSTDTGNLTASETLVEDKGAFGILDDTALTRGGASYLNKNGIPVIGAAIDGPEWGQEPNSNMFSVYGTLETPYNGKIYSYNDAEAGFKALGITRLATVTANAPAAIDAANSEFAAAKPLGISKCLNDIVPLGDVNFTTFALQMKAQKCNGVEVLSLLDSCIAVQAAIKQAGLKVADICSTGYDQSVLSQPTALATMQGTFATATINVLGNDLSAPTKLFLSRLRKYTSWPGGIPSMNIDYAYESADLFIKGLELAGGPNRKAFISDLRKVSSFTTEGLQPPPGEQFTHFGTAASLPKKQCEVIYEIKGHSFVPALGGKPACGTLVSSPES
jgi:branched-chain amino acid transport system substrate-binding protein